MLSFVMLQVHHIKDAFMTRSRNIMQQAQWVNSFFRYHVFPRSLRHDQTAIVFFSIVLNRSIVTTFSSGTLMLRFLLLVNGTMMVLLGVMFSTCSIILSNLPLPRFLHLSRDDLFVVRTGMSNSLVHHLDDCPERAFWNV